MYTGLEEHVSVHLGNNTQVGSKKLLADDRSMRATGSLESKS